MFFANWFLDLSVMELAGKTHRVSIMILGKLPTRIQNNEVWLFMSHDIQKLTLRCRKDLKVENATKTPGRKTSANL